MNRRSSSNFPDETAIPETSDTDGAIGIREHGQLLRMDRDDKASRQSSQSDPATVLPVAIPKK